MKWSWYLYCFNAFPSNGTSPKKAFDRNNDTVYKYTKSACSRTDTTIIICARRSSPLLRQSFKTLNEQLKLNNVNWFGYFWKSQLMCRFKNIRFRQVHMISIKKTCPGVYSVCSELSRISCEESFWSFSLHISFFSLFCVFCSFFVNWLSTRTSNLLLLFIKHPFLSCFHAYNLKTNLFGTKSY